eukprot:4865757-Alexandrium_andersonii.AAC.1
MAIVHSEADPVRVTALLAQVWAQCAPCALQGLHFGHRHEKRELQGGRRGPSAQSVGAGQHRCVVRGAVERPLVGG